MSTSPLPLSEHFTLLSLAEGVYAALASENGSARSNAGIVDLGDRTVIFDTFDAPQAAADLRAAAQQLTGRQPTWVLNSHAHGDHCNGNQVFADAVIVSTQRARAEMMAAASEMARLQNDPSELLAAMRELEASMRAETDPLRRAELEKNIIRQRKRLEVLPTLRPSLPSLAFESKLVFHGSQRVAEWVAAGHRHSAGDAYLLLPAERIAFLGDIGFFQRPPFMGGCDPQNWAALLDALTQSDLVTFVPGHGPVGLKSDLDLLRQYMRMLTDRVAKAIQAGEPLEVTMRQPLPERFRAWGSPILRTEDNVKFLHRMLAR